MVSKQLLNELNSIMVKDYSCNLSAYDLANLADSLKGYFECLTEIQKNND